MKKFFAMIFLVFLLTACLGSAPTQTNSDAVGTVVAGTLTALPSATSTPEPTATLTSEPTITFTPEPTTVLPRSLYYLAADPVGNWQIYRLEKDGITTTQITDVNGGVTGFDISPLDGSIAFAAKNRLFISNLDGGNREPIAKSSDSEILGFPLWSPDGKMVFYKFGRDVVFYSVDTGKSEILFAASKKEDNFPISFSPDGGKLLLGKQKRPESTVFIYNFASQTLTPINWVVPTDNQSPFSPYPCYGYITWNTSDEFYCHFHFLAGAVGPGLWRVNANDGSFDELLWSSTPPFLMVGVPRQDTNGTLYYLYGEEDGVFSQGDTFAPFSLVRSDSDGKTNRIVVRPESFHFLNGLWIPDGKALVIIQSNGTDTLPVNMLLVPVDSSLPVVTLIADASKVKGDYLRWGN